MSDHDDDDQGTNKHPVSVGVLMHCQVLFVFLLLFALLIFISGRVSLFRIPFFYVRSNHTEMSRKDEAKPKPKSKPKPKPKSKSNAKQKFKRKTTGDPSDDDPSDDDESNASGPDDDVGAADAIDAHPWDDWTAKKHEKHQAKVHTLFHCFFSSSNGGHVCVCTMGLFFFVQGST